MAKSDGSIEDQRFIILFNQALVGMAQTDLGGRFLLVNQRFAEMVGRTPEELGRLRMQDITHPDDLGDNLALFERLAAGGSGFIIDKRYVRPDGSSVWVNNAVSLLSDGEGRPQSLVAISQDITERKRSELQLRFLSDASRVLSEWPEDAVRALREITRLACASVATYCIAELVQPDGNLCRVAAAHRDPAREPILQQVMCYPLTPSSPLYAVLERGEARLDAELSPELQRSLARSPELLAAIQALGPHSVMTVPLKARSQVLGVLLLSLAEPGRRYHPDDLAMAQELAHRTVATLENARLFRESEDAVRLRDEFLSVASHELRTPLMSLTLQLELIQRDLSEESHQQVDTRLSAVRRQVSRLTLLVENLLDVKRITAGKLEVERSDVDLVQVVRDVLDRMRGVLHPSGSEIRVHAPSEPIVGHWDAARLDQVLVNLLGNAVRYGQGQPISVSIRADNDHAWLSIRDEGIGIAPEDLERIFGRFERAVSRRHYGGLGLGLYITRQIVEALGGQVRVESEPGRGSLFEVRLPRSGLR